MSPTTSIRKGIKRSTNVSLTVSPVDKARSMDMNRSTTRVPLLAQSIEAKNNIPVPPMGGLIRPISVCLHRQSHF